MDILYFSYEYQPFIVGGLGTYATEMTQRLVKSGQNVTVFSKNYNGSKTRELLKGVDVHRPILTDVADVLPIIVPEEIQEWPKNSQEYFADVFLYNILSASKAISELVKGEGRSFDIIASHDWLSSIAGIVSMRALKKNFVFHFHSTEQGRTRDGSPKIKKLERMTGEIADAIVTVSSAMKDELSYLGYDEKKIQVIPNGVDPEKYNPERVSKEDITDLRKELGVEDVPMILFLGRLVGIKGADNIVRAMPKILEEVPEAKLVILGKGEQEEEIKSLIRDLDLSNSVVLKTEFVSEEKRIQYYAACDFAVFPSKYEPFGLVCTEAMAMGKPIIVGAKGISGFREQIVPSGPKRCGSHIDPYSSKDIAEYAIELLEDEKLRDKLGSNARKRVLNNYTLDIVAKSTIDFYESVVESR